MRRDAPVPPARIRPARPEDAAALALLRYEFRSAHGDVEEDPEAFVGRCSAWMERRFGPDARWRAWVAETVDGAQGQVRAGIEPSGRLFELSLAATRSAGPERGT